MTKIKSSVPTVTLELHPHESAALYIAAELVGQFRFAGAVAKAEHDAILPVLNTCMKKLKTAQIAAGILKPEEEEMN